MKNARSKFRPHPYLDKLLPGIGGVMGMASLCPGFCSLKVGNYEARSSRACTLQLLFEISHDASCIASIGMPQDRVTLPPPPPPPPRGGGGGGGEGEAV